jgi:hypothetical protein
MVETEENLPAFPHPVQPRRCPFIKIFSLSQYDEETSGFDSDHDTNIVTFMPIFHAMKNVANHVLIRKEYGYLVDGAAHRGYWRQAGSQLPWILRVLLLPARQRDPSLRMPPLPALPGRV